MIEKSNSRDSKFHWTIFFIALFSLIIVLGLIFAYRLYFPSTSSSTSNVAPSQWVPIDVNSENLPIVLESTSIVHDLPSDGLISLKIGESRYKIEGDSVVPGDITNPDVEITLPDKYFEIIGQRGFCSALAEANNNGDLGIDYSGSSASLAWKYRALGKYKSCLGA